MNRPVSTLAPVIFFSHRPGTPNLPFGLPPHISCEETTQNTRPPTKTDIFVADWAQVASERPALVKRLMRSPYEVPDELLYYTSRGVQQDLFRYALPVPSATEQRANITGASRSELASIFTKEPIDETRSLVVMYHPERDIYRVELWNPVETGVNAMLKGMEVSLLHREEWSIISQILAVPDTLSFIMGGGLLMFVPTISLLAPPRLVSISLSSGRVILWSPRNGQLAPLGSPITLHQSETILERFSVGDILDKISSEAERARSLGKEPAVALDLDGTLFDARHFTTKIFMEWVDNYNGPLAPRIRDEVSRRGEIKGWNNETILRSILEQMGIELPDRLDDIDSSHPNYEAAQAVLSAKRHFEENFFSPTRRAREMGPIKGMVEFVKTIKSLGVRTIFVTLRDQVDDSLPDGRSASIEALKRYGLWDKTSTLVRYEPEKKEDRIDWTDFEKIKAGAVREPNKADLVRRHIRESGGRIWFIGMFDNDPKHVKGYQDARLRTFFFHVEGDIPPGSPREAPDGSFAINPSQLLDDLRKWKRISALTGILAAPRWKGLMEKYNRAIKENRRPVVFVGIGDTLLTTKDGRTQQIKGASKFINALHQAGVQIVYITGRLEEERDMTLETLTKFGFPIPEEGAWPKVRLVMRRYRDEDEVVYKARMQSLILDRIGGAMFIGAFDNDPDTLKGYRRSFPEAALFLVGEISQEDAKLFDLVPIRDFAGR